MDARAACACLGRAREAALTPDGGWPEWAFDAPVALVTAEGTILWGHPAPPPDFAPMASPPGTPPGPLHRNPAAIAFANSTADVSGHITATVRLEDEPPGPRAERLILHEAFHAFQKVVRPASGVPFHRTAFYPEDLAANNALARAENLALVAFLEGQRGATETAGDVLLLRETRHACIGAEWPAYEGAAEWCEGGAQAAEAFAYGDGVREELAAALRRHNIAGAGASYLRFYATGATIALLLAARMGATAAKAGWLKAPTPLDVLRGCASRDPWALSRWHALDLLAEEAEATGRGRAESAALLQSLNPAIVVDVTAAPPTSFQFNPSALRGLGDGRRLHGGTAVFEGPGWALAVPEGRVLEDTAGHTLTLPVPTDARFVEGEGAVDAGGLRAARARVARDGQGWRVTVWRTEVP